MMKIKLAESAQFSAVYRFYREICEALKGQEFQDFCGHVALREYALAL